MREYKVDIYPKETQKDFFDAMEEYCGGTKFWEETKVLVRDGKMDQAFGGFIIGANEIGEGDNNLFIEQAYNALLYYRNSLGNN